jgi:hypothetical protein
MQTKVSSKLANDGYWKKKFQRLLKKDEVVKAVDLKQKTRNKDKRRK